jgi:hypothetical protein
MSWIFVHVGLSVCISFCLSVYHALYLNFCLYVFHSIFLSVCLLSVCIYVCLYIHCSLWLPVDVYARQSACICTGKSYIMSFSSQSFKSLREASNLYASGIKIINHVFKKNSTKVIKFFYQSYFLIDSKIALNLDHF